MTVEKALESWPLLNQTLMSAGEQDCLNLLEWETSHMGRLVYALRIHARMNKLRGRREREEIRGKCIGR